MTNQIEFYFDFVSPYTYLAHKRVMMIEKLEKIKFIYKPILLGGLHNLAGITAPALIKSKKKFLIDDCEMVAKKFKINFKFNEKFPINSLSLMRGMLVIKDDIKDIFIDKFFDAYWSLNSDLENKEIVSEILKEINIDPVIFYKNIIKQETKDNLKNITQQAFEKKIFGAPTFIVNNKIFWGQDRLEYAITELKK